MHQQTTFAQSHGRALGVGLGAAIASAVLYHVLRVATGLALGILVLAVGHAVGVALRRGGRMAPERARRALAVGLTYAAIGLGTQEQAVTDEARVAWHAAAGVVRGIRASGSSRAPTCDVDRMRDDLRAASERGDDVLEAHLDGAAATGSASPSLTQRCVMRLPSRATAVATPPVPARMSATLATARATVAAHARAGGPGRWRRALLLGAMRGVASESLPLALLSGALLALALRRAWRVSGDT